MFLINVPIIVVAIVGALALIPESFNADHQGLDVPGLTLSAVGSITLVDGIIEAPSHGWLSPRTSTLVLLGVIALLAFLLWERRTPTPMLSSAVFRDRRFGGPLITIAGLFFTIFGGLFLITQHLQLTLGYSPLAAGVHMLAMCTAVVVAPNVPRLVQRFGLGPVSALGPLLVAIGAAMLAAGPTPGSLRVLGSLALLGAGVGFGAPASVDSVLSSTPADQSATGSAVADVAAQFGGGLGIAIIGSAATTAGSLQAGLAVGAAVSLGAGLAAFAVLPGRRDAVTRQSVS